MSEQSRANSAMAAWVELSLYSKEHPVDQWVHEWNSFIIKLDKCTMSGRTNDCYDRPQQLEIFSRVSRNKQYMSSVLKP